jgi:RNA polymerase sigma-70 factor (ECF subfamily)
MEPPTARPPPDDRALVERAQRGDQAAFRMLVERYQRRVVSHALSMVKDPDEAMDIAQETFVRVHRYLPSFKGDSSFFTWTWRIATNLCLDAARKKGRGERLGMTAHGDEEDAREAEIEAGMDPVSAALAGPGRRAENRELADKLQEALGTLSENHRTILLLRELEGLSYEELSQTLGIRKGTVMSRLFHARLKMQRKLREYLGSDAPKGAGDEDEGDARDAGRAKGGGLDG